MINKKSFFSFSISVSHTSLRTSNEKSVAWIPNIIFSVYRFSFVRCSNLNSMNHANSDISLIACHQNHIRNGFESRNIFGEVTTSYARLVTKNPLLSSSRQAQQKLCERQKLKEKATKIKTTEENSELLSNCDEIRREKWEPLVTKHKHIWFHFEHFVVFSVVFALNRASPLRFLQTEIAFWKYIKFHSLFCAFRSCSFYTVIEICRRYAIYASLDWWIVVRRSRNMRALRSLDDEIVKNKNKQREVDSVLNFTFGDSKPQTERNTNFMQLCEQRRRRHRSYSTMTKKSTSFQLK